MARLLALALIALTVTTGCGDDCSLPQRSSLGVRVTDSLGNPLKVDDVYLRQDGERRECARASPNESWCSFATLVGSISLVVSTEGRELQKQIELTAENSGVEGAECTILGLGHYDFVYDGPACDPSKVVAARGTLIGLDGLPDPHGEVEIQATIATQFRADTCDVTPDGRFTCPSLAGRGARYTVIARIGTSKLAQTADVQAADCQIATPAELRFDRGAVVCDGSTAPAVRVYTSERGKNVLPDSVRSLRVNGETSDCVLEAPTERPGPRAALCPATSRTGGGRYTVTVTYRGTTESQTLTVFDDGCKALSERLGVSFP